MEEIIKGILSSFDAPDSVVMWVLFAVAAVRGLAATVAANIPNDILGKRFSKIIDLLGGNSGYADGSQ